MESCEPPCAGDAERRAAKENAVSASAALLSVAQSWTVGARRSALCAQSNDNLRAMVTEGATEMQASSSCLVDREFLCSFSDF